MSNWITAWANAISIVEHKPESYAKNITLRYLITAPFNAKGIRLTFDNFCGTEPITITRATIANGDGARWVESASVIGASFNKKESITIPAGESRKTDDLPYAIHKGDRLSVSFYLGDFTQMQSAVLVKGPCSKGWYATGDHTADELPLWQSKTNEWVFFLSQIEFLTDESCRTIVCFGDSITAQNWPDELSLLAAAQAHQPTAVVRRAASGCRVLRQYDSLKYDSYGLKADIRLAHELPVSGADTIIIQEGINDIIHPVGVEENPFRPWSELPTAEELIEGLTACIRTARSHGLKVYLGTLLPIEGWRTYALFREDLRQAVNDWIRTTPLCDGCIDFDAVLRDPDRPTAFLPAYDSGDHLHPSSAGYRRMAAEAAAIL